MDARLRKETNAIVNRCADTVCDSSFTVGETLTILVAVRTALDDLIKTEEEAVRRQTGMKPQQAAT